MEQSPEIPLSFHVRMVTMIAILVTLDVLLVLHSVELVTLKGPNMMIMFGFEVSQWFMISKRHDIAEIAWISRLCLVFTKRLLVSLLCIPNTVHITRHQPAGVLWKVRAAHHRS